MSDIVSEYIHLSKLFGGCIDYVQATGGNISVKDGDRIIIKKSGFAMSETTIDKGYILCSLGKLQTIFNSGNDDVTSSILSGDLPGRPSMEVFFHMLPCKYVVHIHPTAFMKYLCSPTFGRLKSMFKDELFIPYLQPGRLLADAIFKEYSSQQIIFLANHGVIFLGDSLETLVKNIHNSFLKISASRSSNLLFLHSLLSISNELQEKVFVKSSFLLSDECRIPTKIRRLTPDFHLFLGDDLLEISDLETLKENVVNYKKEYTAFPKILFYDKMHYIVGSSVKSVDYIEQMYYSYVESYFYANAVEIPSHDQKKLEEDPKEKDRILLFKA